MSDRVRRAVGTLAVAALVAAVCALLGVWQWHRHLARSAAVAVLESWSQATPTPIAEALDDGSGEPRAVTDAQVWQPVSATGHYLDDATVLLRNRPVDGEAGYHVLTPFVVDSGSLAGWALLVDRGFLPSDGDATVVPEVPPAPDGTVDLVARLRVEERASGRDAPAGQVQAIATAEARAAADVAWPAPAIAGYAQAVSEDAATPAGLGGLQEPSSDLGPHLSYAFQWWVFAVGALVGGVLLVQRGDASTVPPRRAVGRDEREEDALIDAQAAAPRRP